MAADGGQAQQGHREDCGVAVPRAKAHPQIASALRPETRLSRTKAAVPAKQPGQTEAQLLDSIGIEDVCAAIEGGEAVWAMAQRFGVNHTALRRWIAHDDRAARVRAARSMASFAYDEQALSTIEAADEPFELAKAKEVAFHLRWRASKFNVRDYGERQQLDVNATIKLTQEQVDERLSLLQERIARRS